MILSHRPPYMRKAEISCFSNKGGRHLQMYLHFSFRERLQIRRKRWEVLISSPFPALLWHCFRQDIARLVERRFISVKSKTSALCHDDWRVFYPQNIALAQSNGSFGIIPIKDGLLTLVEGIKKAGGLINKGFRRCFWRPREDSNLRTYRLGGGRSILLSYWDLSFLG